MEVRFLPLEDVLVIYAAEPWRCGEEVHVYQEVQVPEGAGTTGIES